MLAIRARTKKPRYLPGITSLKVVRAIKLFPKKFRKFFLLSIPQKFYLPLLFIPRREGYPSPRRNINAVYFSITIFSVAEKAPA